MSKDRYVAYVGTYTHGTSIGIHLYDVDVEQGLMKERKVVPINNSSHLKKAEKKKGMYLSLIHISEPTRRTPISYAVFCLTKKILYTTPNPREGIVSRMPASA